MTSSRLCVSVLIYFGLFTLISSSPADAQHGTAPSNYYPDWYNGDTFTGTVVTATDNTITLTYTHGSKTDTFEGHAIAPCNLPSSKSSTSPMPLANVPTGAVITVFYEPKTINVNGQKQKENQIMGISFKEVNGRTVKEEHKAIFYCIPGPFRTSFKAF